MRRGQPDQQGAFDADQAEFRAMQDGTSSVSSSTLDELMSGEAGSLAEALAPNAPFYEREQIGAETLTGDANSVVTLRQKHFGIWYPFGVDRGALTYQRQDPFYEFCLATSIAASYPRQETQRLLRHFERVVRDILIAYAGLNAVGVRFGWPNERDWDKAPNRMDRRVAWMKRQCGYDKDEWLFSLSDKLDAVRRLAKDGRIDVIVRRPVGDNRPGGMTILGQCGCGKHDVDESSRKHEELSLQWLSHFFGRSICAPSPLRVFASSQHIVREDELYVKQSSADVLILDRLRLRHLVADFGDVLEPHLEAFARFKDTVLRIVPALQAASGRPQKKGGVVRRSRSRDISSEESAG